MEKLQELSQAELQDLLDNPQRVESMALESDEIQNIQLEREMALASNRSLAEQNLDMKPRLEAQRGRLVGKYTELEGVREKYRQHCAQRDGIMGQVSPEGLFCKLQVEGAETEAESEALADQLLDGSLPLESFLERFLSLRSLAHKRRVRTEKLQELLRQKSAGGGSDPPASSAAVPPPAATQPPAASAIEPARPGAPSPWQPSQPPAPGPKPNGACFPTPSTTPAGAALPYPPYPVAPPSLSGPANPPAQFPPYPSPGSSFTPAAGFGASSCPYPTQPAFPSPSGVPFGQFAPQNYPAPYQYPGYNYPGGPSLPSNQSPTGRPLYRPGYGVPQPYS